MKNHFVGLNPKLFKTLTIFYGILGDILICFYIWNKFSDKDLFFKVMSSIFPLELNAFDDQFRDQLYQLNIQNLKALLGLYLFLHAVVYVCHILDRKFTKTYLKFFSWVAAPCCLSFGLVSLFERSGFLNGLFFVQGLLYLYIALGFYYRKVGATN